MINDDGEVMMTNAELRRKYVDLVEEMLALNANIDKKLKTLETKQEQYSASLAKVNSSKALAHLNVGSPRFAQTPSSPRFTHTPSSPRFTHMAGKPKFFPDHEDQSPMHFGFSGLHESGAQIDRILSSLRTESSNHVSHAKGSFVWDAQRCSTNVTIGDHGRTVTRTSFNRLWSYTIANVPNEPSFMVKVHQPECDIRIGFVKGDAFQADRYNPQVVGGWFLSSLGHLYSDADGCRFNFIHGLSDNDIVEVLFDEIARTITFEINHRTHGVAFDAVIRRDGHIYPCVAFGGQGGSVSLIQ